MCINPATQPKAIPTPKSDQSLVKAKPENPCIKSTKATTSEARDVKCFKCQERGHYAKECSNKKQNKDQTALEGILPEDTQEDEPDLRANPFQEGGDDVIMATLEPEVVPELVDEHVPADVDEVNSPKAAPKLQQTSYTSYKGINKDTCAFLGVYLNYRDDSEREITWKTLSAHLEQPSKWNRFNQSSDEGDIEFTSQMIFSFIDLDQRTFNGGFRANQKELSYEPNFPGILIHPRITSNWISIKIGSDLEDMNFTNRMICFRFNHASRPKIEFHGPTQELFRHETTWRMLRDLLALQQDQEPKESPLDHKVTAHLPKRVNLVLYLKNARPNCIGNLQTCVWHPGTLLQAP